MPHGGKWRTGGDTGVEGGVVCIGRPVVIIAVDCCWIYANLLSLLSILFNLYCFAYLVCT